MPDTKDTISINAWTGKAGNATGTLDANAEKWGSQQHVQKYNSLLAADEPPDAYNWRHPAVGWGIVLTENEALSKTDRARAVDASPAIRKLIAARTGAPVFRYRRNTPPGYLRRYFEDDKEGDIQLAGGPRGMRERDALPWYMLIVGTPNEIPWQFQYLLNVSCYTGRLDLDEPGLSRYVDALIGNWDGSSASSNRPVVWATDHGKSDITWLMRNTIADPVAEKLRGDSQIDGALKHLAGDAATASAFIEALRSSRPGFIVTTSHGLTSPVDDPVTMGNQLGYPVDTFGNPVTPTDLLHEWQPDGAVWYAHACCSAGSDDSTSYAGLVSEGSLVEQTLNAIAASGARVAPLPRALLGAEKPARAFIGHIEPTFDYTLRSPANKQVLTASIQKALYDHMFRKRPEPVGLAFAECYGHVGQLYAQWQQLRRDVAKNVPNARIAAMQAQLMAIDRQSLVILGDPTVALRPLD